MTIDLNFHPKLAGFMLRGNKGDHFQSLGIHLDSITENKLVMRLDYHEDLVGNPVTGAISGGAVTALLDTCSGFMATVAQDPTGLTPTIDLRIDYLGVAKPGQPVYAQAQVYRITSDILFLRSTAYQDINKPIAHGTATFMNMAAPAGLSGMRDYVMNYFDKLPSPIDKTGPYSPLGLDVMKQAVQKAQEQNDASILIDTIPYAKFLGIQRVITSEDNKYIFSIKPKASLVGNPTLPAIHGGALGGFMEISATIHLMMKLEVLLVPKVVDFSIDYIRAGKLKETFVRCKIVRFGRKLVNLSVEAWQEDEQTPIAKARMQVLIG